MIKRSFMKQYLACMLFFMLCCCATQEKAPIVEGNKGSNQLQSNETPANPTYPAPSAAPHVTYKLHEVLLSDSLGSIAKLYNVSPHDIISTNHLVKPYYLEPGEVIKIPIYNTSPSDGYLHLPANKQPTASSTPNTVKILPPLATENLQDYNY